MGDNMTLLLYLVSILILLCLVFSSPEPSEYILSFDTSDNPLDIKIAEPYSKNYIILIADWGAPLDSDYVNVQKAVASKMQSFYETQKSKGKNLLFVAAIGDNFYYTGQTCDTFESQWIDIYGTELTSYPWLAVMGNHDWGNSDCYAMCAFNNPSYIDTDTDIAYHCNQCVSTKKGCAVDKYYMPDFGYYYTLNELNFEVIGVEQSYYDCPGGIGGDSNGNDVTFDNCNNSQTVGCDVLEKMATASETMLTERAKDSKNSNFLIINHYPDRGSALLTEFIDNRADGGENDIILSAYGHTHEQRCDEYSSKNETRCALIMTGGGGGCCAEDTLRGFYVIGFNDNKQLIQEYKINDASLTCQYPCDAEIKDETKLAWETCCHTVGDHGFDCSKFNLTQCQKIL